MALPARYSKTGKSFDGGGMSDALLCTDTHLDRQVVVKQLKPGMDQKRLIDEVAALSDLRSKHVVQIYDVVRDEKGEILAIVEEFLPGTDLNSLIPVKSADELIKLAYAISCGISDIHAGGRIHRDIKPNNIKFDAENCLKIFDFGLSRLGKSAETQGAIGTPGYMAPELCTDDNAEQIAFTAAVDVFAFGATVLKLVLGKLPLCLRREPPQLPCSDADFSKLPIGLPQDLASILSSCFEIEPDDRPEMRHVRDRLELHLLRDRHRATFVSEGTPYVLDKDNRAARVGVKGLGSFEMRYNGFRFELIEVQGFVAVNNVQVVNSSTTIPGACVITLGSQELGPQRRHIPVAVSHPEVVL